MKVPEHRRREGATSPGWRPIATAPRDGTPVRLRTADGCIVFAQWAQVEDFQTWLAVTEAAHPPSWDDGVCWDLSADGEPSDPPTHWLPTGDAEHE